MLDVASAVRAVLAGVTPLATETIALRDARGRVLGADVFAGRPLPGFDHAAMDGYAARAAELPATLAVTGAIAAGEDLARGELAVPAGSRLGAGELGLLAALGVAEVTVSRAPRVALIATGDELVDIATVPGPGQLVDSSAHMLAALVRDAGGEPSYLGIARDDRATVAAMITRGLAYDVVITTGGVSVGDRDHVRAALASAGVDLELYKVAMKPGKPFSFGMNGQENRSIPVFGLPGNPVSTLVAFELFVRPALLAMQGAATARPSAPVVLADPYRKPAGRAHYLRARAVRDGDRLVAHLHPKQGSAMLSSLIGCNALVAIAADVTEVGAGQLAPALLLEAV